MIWFGIAFIAGGIICIFVRMSQANKLLQIQSTETSTASELSETAQSVTEGIGKGSFIQAAEVKGVVESSSPLEAEFSGTQCVYYSVRVDREYEETVTERDSEGHPRTSTRRGSETVTSNVRSIPFELRDSTGTVRVNPESAKIIGQKTFERFDQGELQGGSIKIGSFAFSLGQAVIGALGGRRTIGYKYVEESIPVGTNLYVLGEANDKDGTITIAHPSDKNSKFIVSVKSEEELVRSGKKAVTGLLIGAIACGIIGAVLVVLNFFVSF